MHKFEIPNRKYYYCENVATEGTGYLGSNSMHETTPENANLIGSLCDDGYHAPVIDFDYPIEVYPSSKLGHYHLYIHKKMPWHEYKQLLYALKVCNLIESGYVDASIAKGLSAVRPVGVVKPNAPKGVEVLKENAKLRKTNFELKNEIDYLLGRVQELEEQLNDNASKVPDAS